MGKIEVFLGPMFSGKTTALIKRVEELKKQGKKVKVFKPTVDDRYGDSVICSHDKVSLEAYSIKDIEEADVYSCDVVVVDEYFFFKDNLLDYCKKWKDAGKHVLVSGLNLSYLGEPMPFIDSQKGVEDLKKLADDVHFLTAKCAVCGEKATMTERTVKAEGRLIGGAEAYRAVCKKHHPKWKK